MLPYSSNWPIFEWSFLYTYYNLVGISDDFVPNKLLAKTVCMLSWNLPLRHLHDVDMHKNSCCTLLKIFCLTNLFFINCRWMPPSVPRKYQETEYLVHIVCISKCYDKILIRTFLNFSILKTLRSSAVLKNHCWF